MSAVPNIIILKLHKHTTLAILALIATLYSHILVIFYFLYHMMLVNLKLDISEQKGITFQNLRFDWSRSFSMA